MIMEIPTDNIRAHPQLCKPARDRSRQPHSFKTGVDLECDLSTWECIPETMGFGCFIGDDESEALGFLVEVNWLQGCEWEGREGLGGCYPDVGFWGEDGGEGAQERVEVCFSDGHFDVSVLG